MNYRSHRNSLKPRFPHFPPTLAINLSISRLVHAIPTIKVTGQDFLSHYTKARNENPPANNNPTAARRPPHPPSSRADSPFIKAQCIRAPRTERLYAYMTRNNRTYTASRNARAALAYAAGHIAAWEEKKKLAAGSMSASARASALSVCLHGWERARAIASPYTLSPGTTGFLYSSLAILIFT